MKRWRIMGVPSSTQLAEITGMLAAGEMVVYPTETCYGMGVDATNPEAVNKLLAYKGGRQQRATSVAVDSTEMAEHYVKINEMAEHVYKEFLPGPVTVVSESKGVVVPGLESDLQTLGIRIPNHPVAMALIAHFGKPITATSANTSGKKTPYSWQDLQRYTSDRKLAMIGGFVDVGRLPYRPASTVVDTTLNELRVLRQGAIDLRVEAEMSMSQSDRETQQLGKRLIQQHVEKLSTSPLVVALQGELGAGKTQFVKGLAHGLGITQTVTSPTYQIMREYDYRCGKVSGKLVHIDTWRLFEGDELMELGFEDLLQPGNVVAVEWLQKVRGILEEYETKVPTVWVSIEQRNEPEQREIRYRLPDAWTKNE